MQIAINKTVRPLIVAKCLPSHNNAPNFVSVRLMPGSNEIDTQTAEALEKSATARHWISSNMLEVKAPKSEAEGLAGFDSDAAVAFVAECMDMATLERWEETEKRREVKSAVKKRQKELEKVLNQETR